MHELTRKATLALLLVLSGLLSGRGVEPLTTLCTGTAPTISVPAAWTDGETVPGDTPLAVDAHSLTGDTVTVTVDGLTATAQYAMHDYNYRGSYYARGEVDGYPNLISQTRSTTETRTQTVRDTWTLRVSGTPSAAGLPVGAFRDCTNLVSVTLPKGVTAKGAWTFAGCPNLARVDAPTLRDWFAVAPADADANPLSWGAALYVGGIPVRLEGPHFDRLVIPEGVTRTPAEIFQGCTNFVLVTIPDSVTYIGDFAFSGCTGLKGVTIPGGVTEIGNSTFYGCMGLLDLVIPDSVTDIGGNAFKGCTGLSYVKVSAYVVDRGFADVFDPGLAAWVEVSEGVTRLGDNAFNGCAGLVEVVLPADLADVSGFAFSGCGGLAAITVFPKNPFYSSRNGLLLSRDGTELVGGVNGDVVIPDGVSDIGDSAFRGRSGLTGVTVPSSVTHIGTFAFEGCTSLARVRLPRRFERRLGPNVFAGCGEGLVLDYYDEVPRSSYEVAVVYDAAGGTVTGGGTYAAGKKVVLKAVAKKGYVFAGWELEGAALPEGADLQDPSLTLVAGGGST